MVNNLQGFPLGVDLWGWSVKAKRLKTAWKLQNQHFCGKSEEDRRRGQANFSSASPSRHKSWSPGSLPNLKVVSLFNNYSPKMVRHPLKIFQQMRQDFLKYFWHFCETMP